MSDVVMGRELGSKIISLFGIKGKVKGIEINMDCSSALEIKVSFIGADIEADALVEIFKSYHLVENEQ